MCNIFCMQDRKKLKYRSTVFQPTKCNGFHKQNAKLTTKKCTKT